MSRLALFLLGPPRIERDGKPVRIHRRKAVALIAYLAVTGRRPGGQSHSRDALATLLWPEHDQSRARAGLRGALAALRKALGTGWLDIDQETVRLHREAEVWLDVVEFQNRLAACRTHGHPEDKVCPACFPLLTEAATLYRDDFLAGFTLRDSPAFDEWQFFQTEGLRNELASALERLVHHHSSQGEYEPAIAYARRWLALDSLHEPTHCCLIELYALAGRHTAALRQYRACMRILEEELGLTPSAETTALYERIRAERARPPERDIIPPTPPHPISPRLPAFLRSAQDAILTGEKEPAAVERHVFVARERQLAQLDGYLEAALAGHGKVVLVTGGPGRGKSALLGEFTRRAMGAHPELLVASGNCNAYSGLGDPYLPFREVMAMLTGDVKAQWAAGVISRDHAQRLWAGLPFALQALVDYGPFLIDTVVPGPPLLSRATEIASDSPGWLGQLEALVEQEKPSHSDLGQSALFEQFTNVLRTLAEAHPLVLTLDDVQWADIGSISLLFHLGRRLEGVRILIACAYRPEEVASGRDGPSTSSGQRERHSLESVLAEFKRRFGDVWVDLTQADETEGRRFVDAFLDTEPNRLGEDFRRELFQHAGGHPLFTIELLRAMQERGYLIQDEEGRWVEGPEPGWETLPARVEAVIEERVSRLEEGLRDILAVASVEGEWFTAQVVAQVQDIPEREMLRALSQELVIRHRLVREEKEVQIDRRFLSHYRFAHALFQQYLYNGLSAGERRLLHGEVAAALEELYRSQIQKVAVDLAYHYAEAGRAEKAIEYLLRAGDQARVAYANEEAMAHFHRASELLDGSPLGESRKDWRLKALKGPGQIHARIGQFAEAEAYYREAITLARDMEVATRELVRLYGWLGETLWWQNQYDEAIRIAQEGLTLLGDDTESVEAALMNQIMGAGYGGQGDWDRFREITYRTARFIQRLPYSREVRETYHHLVDACLYDKDIVGVMKWLRALEEKATPRHDLTALGPMQFHMGWLLARSGDLRGAISRLQQGLDLCTRIGDVKIESWCLIFMGMTFLALGDLHRAHEFAIRALDAAKAVGHKRDLGLAYRGIGQVCLCQGAWESAVDAFQNERQFWREIGYRSDEAWAAFHLGKVCLATGDPGEAVRHFKEAIALAGEETLRQNTGLFASVLSGLEGAHEDSERFRAFCGQLCEEHPEVGDSVFVNWYLAPTEPRSDVRSLISDFGVADGDFESLKSEIRNGEWVWQDPLDDCSFTVDAGLEVYAANGRDLWHLNLSAPRLLRPAWGDLAVQAVCVPVSDPANGGQKPAIGAPAVGGLVLWKDKENHLRLDRGMWGEREVFLGGCLGNQDVVIGRGRLPVGESGQAGRVFLRLERIGGRVNALCSADGENWFTVGHVAFPVENPIQVGLYASGNIDRVIYSPGCFLDGLHAVYPDGTAIRFESFQLWGM